MKLDSFSASGGASFREGSRYLLEIPAIVLVARIELYGAGELGLCIAELSSRRKDPPQQVVTNRLANLQRDEPVGFHGRPIQIPVVEERTSQVDRGGGIARTRCQIRSVPRDGLRELPLAEQRVTYEPGRLDVRLRAEDQLELPDRLGPPALQLNVRSGKSNSSMAWPP